MMFCRYHMLRIFFTILFGLGTALHLSSSESGPRPTIRPDELERQIHGQINRVRPLYGLASLDMDEHLTAIARGHSGDMARLHYFSHINTQGESPSDRALRQGWNRQKQIGRDTLIIGVAENIFQSSLYGTVFTTRQKGVVVKRDYAWKNISQLAETVVQGWLNSPPHRKIILSPRYEREGIGVFISGDDVYVTQNLF